MATSLVRNFLLTFFMPQRCYEELVVNLHWHVPCLLYVLKRAAGYWIVLDTLLAPLPQLLKMLWRGRADGLSPPSVLLQLYAASCPVVYAAANGFPLFAWAERLLTLVQIAAIAFLVLHHRGQTVTGVLVLLTYSGLMFLLGSRAPAAVASGMQASTVASLIGSKVLQAAANYRNGHTGQLSVLSVFLTWAGSLGVVFVSLQEAEGPLTTLSHVLSACLSCVLLAQVLAGCWSSSSSNHHHHHHRREKEE